jgi:hypothetical protein
LTRKLAQRSFLVNKNLKADKNGSDGCTRACYRISPWRHGEAMVPIFIGHGAPKHSMTCPEHVVVSESPPPGMAAPEMYCPTRLSSRAAAAQGRGRHRHRSSRSSPVNWITQPDRSAALDLGSNWIAFELPPSWHSFCWSEGNPLSGILSCRRCVTVCANPDKDRMADQQSKS